MSISYKETQKNKTLEEWNNEKNTKRVPKGSSEDRQELKRNLKD